MMMRQEECKVGVRVERIASYHGGAYIGDKGTIIENLKSELVRVSWDKYIGAKDKDKWLTFTHNIYNLKVIDSGFLTDFLPSVKY